MADRKRRSARDSAECPVYVVHASNVTRETIKGFACHVCGEDLAEHEMIGALACQPSQAYAINEEAMDRGIFA